MIASTTRIDRPISGRKTGRSIRVGDGSHGRSIREVERVAAGRSGKWTGHRRSIRGVERSRPVDPGRTEASGYGRSIREWGRARPVDPGSGDEHRTVDPGSGGGGLGARDLDRQDCFLTDWSGEERQDCTSPIGPVGASGLILTDWPGWSVRIAPHRLARLELQGRGRPKPGASERVMWPFSRV